jgi:hypothetical protein
MSNECDATTADATLAPQINRPAHLVSIKKATQCEVLPVPVERASGELARFRKAAPENLVCAGDEKHWCSQPDKLLMQCNISAQAGTRAGAHPYDGALGGGGRCNLQQTYRRLCKTSCTPFSMQRRRKRSDVHRRPFRCYHCRTQQTATASPSAACASAA